MSEPLLYIVIPNKNGIDHLKYSIDSIYKSTYKKIKIVLVDNFSTDNSVEYVKENYKDILVLTNQGKKGFAGGVNTGIKHALISGAEYVAVFSNDIKVLENWIELLLPVFETKSRIGLVGLTEISIENEKLFYDAKLTTNQIRWKDVDSVAGCLYICSRDLFKEIGYLDEDYFMYGEDNDWFFRIKKANYRIIETSVPVWHYGEGSAKKNKFLPTWYSYRNAVRFSIKNQNILMNIKMIFSLLNQGCNVFLEKNHPSIKRLQRYNPVINIFLITGSLIWNLIYLVPTLKAKFNNKYKY